MISSLPYRILQLVALISGLSHAFGGISILAGPLFSGKYEQNVVPLWGFSVDTEAFRWVNHFELTIGGEIPFHNKEPAEMEAKLLLAKVAYLENKWGMLNPGFSIVLNSVQQRGKFLRNLEKRCFTCPSEEYESRTFWAPGIGIQATPALKLFQKVALGGLLRAELNTAGPEAYAGILLGYRR